jgi:rRNA maturation protein Nop10
MICPNRECPDFLVNGFPGEYVDTLTVCPVCGAHLVAAEPQPNPSGDPRLLEGDVEVVEIFSSPHPTEVAVVRALLDGAGIPYLIDRAGDVMFPGLTASIHSAGGMTIRVRAEDAKTAQELLETTPIEPETDW